MVKRDRVIRSNSDEVKEAKKFIEYLHKFIAFDVLAKYRCGEIGGLYKRATVVILYEYYKEISAVDLMVRVFESSENTQANQYVRRHYRTIDYDNDYKAIYEKVRGAFNNYLSASSEPSINSNILIKVAKPVTY